MNVFFYPRMKKISFYVSKFNNLLKFIFNFDRFLSADTASWTIVARTPPPSFFMAALLEQMKVENNYKKSADEVDF